MGGSAGRGSRGRCAARLAGLALVVLMAAAHPATVRGQDASHPFPPLRVSPDEPLTRVAAAWTDRTGTSRAVGLVDFGARIPFWLHRAPTGRLELAASLAGGAFSRFDLERSDNELIEVHYRAAVRLRARLARTALRLELHHASSHLGDEHLERTGRDPVSTSREGAELLVEARPSRALRLYAGPGVLLRSSRALGRASGRAGLEWEAAGTSAPLHAYAGLDAFLWEEVGWEPRVAAEAGLARGRFRVGVLLGAGPTRAEQLLPEEERLLGAVVSILH